MAKNNKPAQAYDEPTTIVVKKLTLTHIVATKLALKF